MSIQASLIDELEAAIATKTIGRRAEALRKVTDLFLTGSGRYRDEDIDLFDDVLGRLYVEIELAARIELAVRLADISDAPPRLMRKMARDEAIEVAGPVLSKSNRLDDATLIEMARTRQQDHLLAIAQRENISEAVTDILVERGDQNVALTAVRNSGARFSQAGYSGLVQRSSTDERLAVGLWLRADMPHAHLLRLFAEASAIVRVKLETADPRRASIIHGVVAEITDSIQTTARQQSRAFQAAHAHVTSLHAEGVLDAGKLQGFASEQKFDETAVALSLLCDLPIGFVERGLVQERSDLVLIFAKALGLDWETTRSILMLGIGDNRLSPKDLEEMHANFQKLRPETAQKAIRFYRLRERCGDGRANAAPRHA
jgi:uncharacterized protein (DUF2336 family)